MVKRRKGGTEEQRLVVVPGKNHWCMDMVVGYMLKRIIGLDHQYTNKMVGQTIITIKKIVNTVLY